MSVLLRKSKLKQSGFTLIELLVVVAIIGILSATFVSMGSLVKDFRVGYINQRLYSSILLARSEAIKRGETITICRSLLGNQCDSGDNWSNGWIVFYDSNGNRRVDESDKLLRVYDHISSDFSVGWSGPDEGFTFNSRGQISFITNQVFTICLFGITDSPMRQITVYGHHFGGGRVKSTSGRGDC